MTDRIAPRHVRRRRANTLPVRALSRLGHLTVVLGTPVLLAGCSDGHISFLTPDGPVASAQRGYFIDINLILLIVVVPVLVLAPFFAWRYRYRNGASPYRPDWSFSWGLEVLIWGAPFLIVIVLAVWLWQGTHELDPYRPVKSSQPPLQVQVVGYDWKWLFIYPSLDVASVGQFAFPADRPVAIKLTSDTVMQSLFIPSLGSQIYAMPGMVTQLHLKADSAGRFLGENAQYNGENFHRQKFSAIAMAKGEFDAWVQNIRREGVPLSAATYKLLSKRNTAEALHDALHADGGPGGVVLLREVSAGLFDRIVKSFHGGSRSAAALVAASPTAPSAGPVMAEEAAKDGHQD